MEKYIKEMNSRKQLIKDLFKRADDVSMEFKIGNGNTITQKILELVEVKNKKLVLKYLGGFTEYQVGKEEEEGVFKLLDTKVKELDETGISEMETEEERTDTLINIVESGLVVEDDEFSLEDIGILSIPSEEEDITALYYGDIALIFEGVLSKRDIKNKKLIEIENQARREFVEKGGRI